MHYGGFIKFMEYHGPVRIEKKVLLTLYLQNMHIQHLRKFNTEYSLFLCTEEKCTLCFLKSCIQVLHKHKDGLRTESQSVWFWVSVSLRSTNSLVVRGFSCSLASVLMRVVLLICTLFRFPSHPPFFSPCSLISSSLFPHTLLPIPIRLPWKLHISLEQLFFAIFLQNDSRLCSAPHHFPISSLPIEG